MSFSITNIPPRNTHRFIQKEVSSKACKCSLRPIVGSENICQIPFHSNLFVSPNALHRGHLTVRIKGVLGTKFMLYSHRLQRVQTKGLCSARAISCLPACTSFFACFLDFVSRLGWVDSRTSKRSFSSPSDCEAYFAALCPWSFTTPNRTGWKSEWASELGTW